MDAGPSVCQFPTGNRDLREKRMDYRRQRAGVRADKTRLGRAAPNCARRPGSWNNRRGRSQMRRHRRSRKHRERGRRRHGGGRQPAPGWCRRTKAGSITLKELRQRRHMIHRGRAQAAGSRQRRRRPCSRRMGLHRRRPPCRLPSRLRLRRSRLPRRRLLVRRLPSPTAAAPSSLVRMALIVPPTVPSMATVGSCARKRRIVPFRIGCARRTFRSLRTRPGLL